MGLEIAKEDIVIDCDYNNSNYHKQEGAITKIIEV